MSIVATLLDKARTRRGIPTDMALAERLGRSRAVVSEWRAGKSYPDEDLIVALAELAGDDPGEWLLAIKAIRTDGKAGKVWAALAKRLATASAVLLCAIGLAVGTPAQANQVHTSNTSDARGVPIMSPAMQLMCDACGATTPACSGSYWYDSCCVTVPTRLTGGTWHAYRPG